MNFIISSHVAGVMSGKVMVLLSLSFIGAASSASIYLDFVAKV